MRMKMCDVLSKYNLVSQLKLKNGTNELSKDLKVKIMKIRIEYAKIQKNYDSDINEFLQTAVPDELRQLKAKTDLSEEEKELSETLEKKLQEEVLAYARSKQDDEVTSTDYSFTLDEFSEIIDVNADTDIVLNGMQVSAPDFLEIIHNIFVKE